MSRRGLWTVLLLTGAVVRPGPPAAGQDAATPAALEDYLRSARVVSLDKSGMSGRTSPWMAALSDGVVERKAVFKYIDRRRPALLPDSFHYELAAYELSKLIGLPVVPPVVERTIEGVPGSLQVYLEACVRYRDLKSRGLAPPDSGQFLNAMAEIRVFENLVYNACANLEDTLVHTEDWFIRRVDFSEAFAPEPTLLSGCDVTRCSRTLYAVLKDLDASRLRSALGAFLGGDEIEALVKRKQLILDTLDRLILDAGEEAVLFGPPRVKDAP